MKHRNTVFAAGFIAACALHASAQTASRNLADLQAAILYELQNGTGLDG